MADPIAIAALIIQAADYLGIKLPKFQGSPQTAQQRLHPTMLQGDADELQDLLAKWRKKSSDEAYDSIEKDDLKTRIAAKSLKLLKTAGPDIAASPAEYQDLVKYFTAILEN